MCVQSDLIMLQHVITGLLLLAWQAAFVVVNDCLWIMLVQSDLITLQHVITGLLLLAWQAAFG